MSQSELENGIAAKTGGKHKDNVGMARIMSFYSPSYIGYITMFMSLLNAALGPVFGYIFAELIFVMMANKLPNYKEQRDKWAGIFLGFIFIVGLISFLQKYLFGYVGENLTFTVRKLLFKGILYKHVSWFDDKKRAPGVLTNLMAEDVTELNGLTTETVAVMIEAFFGIAFGLIIACIFSW